MTRPFLTARWSRLAMINYEVDPEILRSRVPRGTELDTWNDRCFVSVVGFQFLETRLLGFGVPFHRNFVEVNLRYYVRRNVNAEWRRGVVFLKEFVPRRAIAWIAKAVYNERYYALPMSSRDTGSRVQYAWWHAGREHRMAVSIHDAPYQPMVDSEESFITEHYWGYTSQRDGTTVEYRVEHPPWRVWKCHAHQFDCDVASLYGRELAPALTESASSCFLAEGSDVVVHRGVRIEDAKVMR